MPAKIRGRGRTIMERIELDANTHLDIDQINRCVRARYKHPTTDGCPQVETTITIPFAEMEKILNKYS